MTTEPAARRPRSLALRVTVLVGLVTTILFMLFAWGVERSIETHFARMDLHEMQAAWTSVGAALNQAGTDASGTAARLTRAMAGNRTVAVLVRDAQGDIIAQTTPPELAGTLAGIAPSDTLQLGAVTTVATPGHAWRVAVLRAGPDRVALAMNIDFHRQYLSRLQTTLWAGTLLASIMTVLVAGLAVRQGHTPLRRISARMRELSGEQLHARLDPNRVPIELEELVVAFNAMLDRIEGSFKRLRDVTADMAHELRTPITNLTTQTQVALSQAREADAYREVLYSSLEEYERLSVMIADMLFLAQSDQGHAHLHLELLDFRTETQALFEYFEAFSDERGIHLRVEGAAPAVRGDKAMLRRALSNLLSNAIRYTPQGRSVTVRLGTEGRLARVEICNEGATIAPEQLRNVFERFYRAEPSRQRSGEGSGLGLSIVKSIVELHGGSVAARSADGVTVFTLRVPIAPPAG